MRLGVRKLQFFLKKKKEGVGGKEEMVKTW